ncbi:MULTISPECIES: ergothioneine biosynthesis glutamate--cysteine ligase EgtA [Rhodococcus]|uniref:Glutamate--cysteine ligase EgtA n=1 Tax=Rhodococcus globerulus TaxID=33008 RepID=A0ABU4BPU4_RHOGO|nr:MULTISPECIES: ergothioneine biosynthesis glutamate--cysteine ligase EgtA [Rhodococcus]MDV6266240.1 ergothioneine biosynthesis glutamate--cysteine ligase EgtA [Rhodococcus globerulus]MDV8068804.1 ergothioneine biosynthesis glutamate--cysteine ligase EgtA [Rhodococcus sp. IEGM 1366]
MATAVLETTLDSRPAAEAYIGGVCFKQGPPRLIGTEVEWLTRDAGGGRPSLEALAHALGKHTPTSIDPESPGAPLPGGSYVTVEPGGQIELSSAPRTSAREVCDYLGEDHRVLSALLHDQSIEMYDGSADELREPHRLLRLPRYCAMEHQFASIGPYGTLMMCNTAAVQVSVDAGGSQEAIARRWRLLGDIGPALIAAFACSPQLEGIPRGEWASQRMRTWLELDARRTMPVVDAADYAQWALNVPLMCVRNSSEDWTAPRGATFGDWIDGALGSDIGRAPTSEDLDYHLSTMFPPVRAAGHLEVRYIDAQPGDLWRVPIAAIDALLSGPAVMQEASDAAASTAGRWRDAAEYGLVDVELRSAATSLMSLAASYAPDPEFVRLLDRAAERCCRGLAPVEGT